MNKIIFILASVFAGACTVEASTGFFVTAATGQSRFDTKYTSRYVDAARSSVPNAELNAHNLYWSIGCGYSITDWIRATAGYEDWGKSTASSSSSTGEIYPLTVGARGLYVSYAPILHIIPLISLDPEIGFLYSDIHVGTDFSAAHGVSDSNFKSGYSMRPRYGLGLSVHIPTVPVVVGIKYLQTDLPDTKLNPGSNFFTDKIRPRTVVLAAQYSF